LLIVLMLETGALCHGQDLPAPRPLDEKKTPAKKEDDSTRRPRPVLFPAPPFPPPPPPVMDPRTKAWQQVLATTHGPEVAGAPGGPGPAGHACPQGAHTPLRDWLRKLRCRHPGGQTIEFTPTGQAGEWNVTDVTPGH
jgi:hypothetical protein